MKTTFHFKKVIVFFALALGIFFSSCTKEEPLKAPESENYTLKSATNPQPDDMICDLIAGQHIIAGKVVYSHQLIDGVENLVVEYIAENGWKLTEVHFYVGTLANFEETCMNKKAIQIGKFPYSATNLNGTTKSFTIPLTGPVPEGGYMVVAHAVVKKPGQEETAFANCTYKPIITVKSYMKNADEEYYAISSGIPYNNLSWCKYLGTNIYEKDDEYTLKKWFSLVNVGTINVTDDGTNLLVTVAANAGLLLHTYLYVGTLNGLANFEQDYPEDCLNYTAFPYPAHTESDTHAFSIPNKLSSLSFKDAFGSNRWGWISYYNF